MLNDSITIVKTDYGAHISELLTPIFMLCKDLNDDKTLPRVSTVTEAAAVILQSVDHFHEGFDCDMWNEAAKHLCAPFAEIGPGLISVNVGAFVTRIYRQSGIVTRAGIMAAMNSCLRILNLDEKSSWERSAVLPFLQATCNDLKVAGVKNVNLKFQAVSKRFCNAQARKKKNPWFNQFVPKS